ncbi:hypothetical protein C5167_027055 [Papaver somniferum]|nr:hypothetical protein C5167_027055 [Papaver somniferum]
MDVNKRFEEMLKEKENEERRERRRQSHEHDGKIQEWEAREPIRSVASSEGVHRVDNEFDYEAKFSVLTRRVESLERNAKATQRSMENLQQQLYELASQLNERDKGSFEVTTSGAKPTHHVQAVSTPRSGRVIDNHVSDAKENVQDRNLPTITQSFLQPVPITGKACGFTGYPAC